MKKKFIWLLLSLLIMTAMVFSSCSTKTSSTTSTTSSTTSTAAVIKTSSTTSTTSSTTGTATATSATTTSATGNWWDKYGKPQYGGTMNISINADITNWDPALGNDFTPSIFSGYMERLFTDNIETNPSTFGFWTIYRPIDYVQGQLAQSWEFSDPSTFVVTLRQGVTWQNIAPANGREFVASDVVAFFQRLYVPASQNYGANGSGRATYGGMQSLVSVTATNKYTVSFKWKTTNAELIMETLALAGTNEMCIDNPEAVAQWGDLNDWHHAIGTGPFILKDFVDASSATLVKNPNYWGTDERFPQNKLPYVDGINIFVIPNNNTAIASIRTGKLDALDNNSLTDAEAMQKSNSNVAQFKVPAIFGLSIQPRNDVKPYNDINVRIALQKAIDLNSLAQSYYQGSVDPTPLSMNSHYLTGWDYPYSQWPQSLKDEYSYDPAAAKALLAKAGYPNGFNTDIVVDAPMDQDLVKIIQSDFAAIGVNMSITVMDRSSWTTFVNGHHNDALSADATGGNLGTVTEPLIAVNHFGTGNATDPCAVSDPKFDAFYPQILAATTVNQVKTIVQQVNQYVVQQHYCVSLLQPTVFTFVQPWLKGGFNGQFGAISGWFGPTLLFYYDARFWIDPSLK